MNRILKFLVSCFILVVLPVFIPAQKHEIDSLSVVVESAAKDTSLVNNLNMLTDKIWQTGDYDKAIIYSDKAKALAEKLDFKRGSATAFINASLIYWKQGDYPKALEQDFKALKINEQINNKKGISRTLNSIGLIYFSQKNYSGALQNYFKSLALREEIKDKQGVSGSLNNIGEVYKAEGKADKALENYFKALVINRGIGNRNWESININNIAMIFYGQAITLSPDDPQRKKYFIKALENYEEALKIRTEIGDQQGIALSSLGLGVVNTQLKKFKEADAYFDRALSIAASIGYREGLKEIYLAKTRLDSSRNNWDAAFANQQLYILYRDSLMNEESTRKSVRAEMNFTFDKKEESARLEQAKKDVLVKEEKQRQKIIILAVSVVLIVVAALALVILRSLRQNQRKNRIITLQKEEVERQKHIVEEKQKEITDSINYAERIQRSFLASNDLLSKNLKEHFVFFQPKDIVSGDFYWATELTNGRFLLATADSTGHGVPGAIMSILNISCLEKSVEEKKLLEPAAILDHTRLKIIERLKKDGSAEGGKDGMDCSLISFDLKHNRFTYAAANNPVWIVRFSKEEEKQILIELAADKMPVGKHDKDSISFKQSTVDLQPGDMIYTLTDGMPDQFGGPKGKKFMYKPLKELLISISHLPVNEQKEKLASALKEWKGALEQIDDVCIVGVRV